MAEHIKTLSRRQHSAELKARVLAACSQPGASVSALALAHGLNTNPSGMGEESARGPGMGLMREEAGRA